jgi:hypothetical protein
LFSERLPAVSFLAQGEKRAETVAQSGLAAGVKVDARLEFLDFTVHVS